MTEHESDSGLRHRVPDLAEWPPERLEALYEIAGNWHALTRLGKWMTMAVLFLGAVAALVYYSMAIMHGDTSGGKG